MEKLIYTIVGIAPKSIQESFNNVKSFFNLPFTSTNNENGLILKDTAHFAIKKTFTLRGDISEMDFIDKLNKISLGEKMPLRCSNLGMFTQSAYGDILFCKIEPNTKLQQLHMKIKTVIDSMVDTKDLRLEGNNYLPHLSIVYNLPANISQEVKLYAEKNIIPLDFELNKVFLLKGFDTIKDEREVLASFNLN